MLILVKLKNRLISRALVEMLGATTGHRVYLQEKKLAAEGLDPDIVLCDALTCGEGIDRQWPRARHMLVDTGLEEQELFWILSTRRIDGVLTAEMDPELLEKALSAVRKGEFWLPHLNFKKFLQRVRETKPARLPVLKDQDRRILELITQGRRNREIAKELHLSEQTIKAHVSRIFRLFNVSNRAQLVRLVMAANEPFSLDSAAERSQRSTAETYKPDASSAPIAAVR